MTDEIEQTWTIHPKDAPTEEAGTWLWALEDSRRALYEVISGVSQETIDFATSYGGNSIGTLLYHIAAVDMNWMFKAILATDFTAEVLALLPYPTRNDEGKLNPVIGETFDEHRSRLDRTRCLLVESVMEMTSDDFRMLRKTEYAEVSPSWVLYHLQEHEHYHRGQIRDLRRQAEGF